MSKLRAPPAHILRALDDHALWLRSAGKEGKLFSGHGRIDLRGLALDNVDLTLAFLTFNSFEGSSLRGTCLIGADLEGTSFKGVDLTGACLDLAYLAAADFIGAKYHQASFEGANTEDAFWRPTDSTAYYKRCRSRVSADWTKVQREDYNAQCLTLLKERRKVMLRDGFAHWCKRRGEFFNSPQLTPFI